MASRPRRSAAIDLPLIAEPPLDADIDGLRRALLDWYAGHRRVLPWREADGGDPDPYAVWVSEVMLQQTQVATVEPYFRQWMARFPSVQDLAEARLDQVLAAWQGLGYYSRARNLHQAALLLVSEHGGVLPDDLAALRRLPGLGDYSAGAIASIAFGRPAPAIDGNVRRVLSRLGAIAGAVDRAPGAGRIRELAERLHRDGPASAIAEPSNGFHPGDLNQALMELGATVCRPRRPDCPLCPLRTSCAAFQLGRTGDFPESQPRTAPREVRVFSFALEDGEDRWLVARRPDKGLWGGLWEFPVLEAAPDDEPATLLGHVLGWPLAQGWRRTAALVHVLSHRRLIATPIVGQVPPGATGAAKPVWPPYVALRWVNEAELLDRRLPRSRLMDRIIEATGIGERHLKR